VPGQVRLALELGLFAAAVARLIREITQRDALIFGAAVLVVYACCGCSACTPPDLFFALPPLRYT